MREAPTQGHYYEKLTQMSSLLLFSSKIQPKIP